MSENEVDASTHPCQRCGACCAAYRVSFYWADGVGHGLPEALTERLTPWHACMAGTQGHAPRCVALDGVVGRDVGCRVYAQRPSPCRELQPGEDKCLRARQRRGLPPLAPRIGVDDVVRDGGGPGLCADGWARMPSGDDGGQAPLR